MNEILVRKIEKKDFNDVLIIFKASLIKAFDEQGIGHLKEELQNNIDNKKEILEKGLDKIFIIKKDKNIVGVGAYGEPKIALEKIFKKNYDNILEIHSFYIHPKYQGYGYGQRLLKYMINEIKNKEKNKNFILQVGFDKAKKFWRKHFDKETLIIKDYWGKGADNYIWYVKLFDNKKLD